jgi:integrase
MVKTTDGIEKPKIKDGIEKRGDKYRIRVRINGEDRSETFSTKAECKVWRDEQRTNIVNEKHGRIPNKTFGDLLVRYMNEVSINKDGGEWEKKRIKALVGEGKSETPDPISKVNLRAFCDTHIIEWRDRRLKAVSGSAVIRDWALWSSACSHAKSEWKWLKHNYFFDVTKPKGNPPRTRRVGNGEIDKIIDELGYSKESKLEAVSERIAAAFLFAVETGLRTGEICKIKRRDVNLLNGDGKEPFVNVTATEKGARKTGTSRVVPLSREAVRLIRQLEGIAKGDGDYVFGVNAPSVDTVFRRIKTRLGIVDLHFHDSRAEALTRMSAKPQVNALRLGKISGHKKLDIILNTYYRESAEGWAPLLDEIDEANLTMQKLAARMAADPEFVKTIEQLIKK